MSEAGFTLTEVVIAVGVLGILIAVAAPNFAELARNMGLSSTQARLFADLQRARGESVKRNGRVLVCVANTGATACGTATNWANGWLVCADFDADGVCDASTTENENPFKIEPAPSNQITITAPAASVRFNADGSQGTGAAVSFSMIGTWAGATAKTASIAGSGHITKN